MSFFVDKNPKCKQCLLELETPLHYKGRYGVNHFGKNNDPIKLKVSIYDNID